MVLNLTCNTVIWAWLPNTHPYWLLSNYFIILDSLDDSTGGESMDRLSSNLLTQQGCVVIKCKNSQWFLTWVPGPTGGLNKLWKGPQDDLKLFKLIQNKHSNKLKQQQKKNNKMFLSNPFFFKTIYIFLVMPSSKILNEWMNDFVDRVWGCGWFLE